MNTGYWWNYVVAKPLYGREGTGVIFGKEYNDLDTFKDKVRNGTILGPSIYQKFVTLPEMQKRKIQMGAWIIGGNFGGLAFRESKDYKFKDGSPFLPHVVRGDLP